MFEFFQPLDVGGLQPSVLGLPLIVGGGADAVLPPDLVDGSTRIGLLQHADDLRFGELRLAHRNLLAKGGYAARRFSFWIVYFLGELTQAQLAGISRASVYSGLNLSVQLSWS